MRQAVEQGRAQRADAATRNTGAMGDLGTAFKVGALNLPSTITNLADTALDLTGKTGQGSIISRGADALGDFTGLDFDGKAKEVAAREYTREALDQQQNIQNAEGFGNTLKAAATNLRGTATIGVQSLPGMLAGGVGGRVLKGAGLVKNAVTGAAVGEGALIAGETKKQVAEEGGDAQKGAAAALAAGVGGAFIGYFGGRLAENLGIVDPDAFLAGSGRPLVGQQTARSIGYRVAGGALQEGVLEEMPQSALEQIASNYATDKPLGEGIGSAAALGLALGAGMGATFNIIPPKRAQDPAKPEDVKKVTEPPGLAAMRQEYSTWSDEQLFKERARLLSASKIISETPEAMAVAQALDGTINNLLAERGYDPNVMSEPEAQVRYQERVLQRAKLLTRQRFAASLQERTAVQEQLAKLDSELTALDSQFPGTATKAAQDTYNDLFISIAKNEQKLKAAAAKGDKKSVIATNRILAGLTEQAQALSSQSEEPLTFTGEQEQLDAALNNTKYKAKAAKKGKPVAQKLQEAEDPQVAETVKSLLDSELVTEEEADALLSQPAVASELTRLSGIADTKLQELFVEADDIAETGAGRKRKGQKLKKGDIAEAEAKRVAYQAELTRRGLETPLVAPSEQAPVAEAAATVEPVNEPKAGNVFTIAPKKTKQGKKRKKKKNDGVDEFSALEDDGTDPTFVQEEETPPQQAYVMRNPDGTAAVYDVTSSAPVASFLQEESRGKTDAQLVRTAFADTDVREEKPESSEPVEEEIVAPAAPQSEGGINALTKSTGWESFADTEDGRLAERVYDGLVDLDAKAKTIARYVLRDGTGLAADGKKGWDQAQKMDQATLVRKAGGRGLFGPLIAELVLEERALGAVEPSTVERVQLNETVSEEQNAIADEIFAEAEAELLSFGATQLTDEQETQLYVAMQAIADPEVYAAFQNDLGDNPQQLSDTFYTLANAALTASPDQVIAMQAQLGDGVLSSKLNDQLEETFTLLSLIEHIQENVRIADFASFRSGEIQAAANAPMTQLERELLASMVNRPLVGQAETYAYFKAASANAEDTDAILTDMGRRFRERVFYGGGQPGIERTRAQMLQDLRAYINRMASHLAKIRGISDWTSVIPTILNSDPKLGMIMSAERYTGRVRKQLEQEMLRTLNAKNGLQEQYDGLLQEQPQTPEEVVSKEARRVLLEKRIRNLRAEPARIFDVWKLWNSLALGERSKTRNKTVSYQDEADYMQLINTASEELTDNPYELLELQESMAAISQGRESVALGSPEFAAIVKEARRIVSKLSDTSQDLTFEVMVRAHDTAKKFAESLRQNGYQPSEAFQISSLQANLEVLKKAQEQLAVDVANNDASQRNFYTLQADNVEAQRELRKIKALYDKLALTNPFGPRSRLVPWNRMLNEPDLLSSFRNAYNSVSNPQFNLAQVPASDVALTIPANAQFQRVNAKLRGMNVSLNDAKNILLRQVQQRISPKVLAEAENPSFLTPSDAQINAYVGKLSDAMAQVPGPGVGFSLDTRNNVQNALFKFAQTIYDSPNAETRRMRGQSALQLLTRELETIQQEVLDSAKETVWRNSPEARKSAAKLLKQSPGKVRMAYMQSVQAKLGAQYFDEDYRSLEDRQNDTAQLGPQIEAAQQAIERELRRLQNSSSTTDGPQTEAGGPGNPVLGFRQAAQVRATAARNAKLREKALPKIGVAVNRRQNNRDLIDQMLIEGYTNAEVAVSMKRKSIYEYWNPAVGVDGRTQFAIAPNGLAYFVSSKGDNTYAVYYAHDPDSAPEEDDLISLHESETAAKEAVGNFGGYIIQNNAGAAPIPKPVPADPVSKQTPTARPVFSRDTYASAHNLGTIVVGNYSQNTVGALPDLDALFANQQQANNNNDAAAYSTVLGISEARDLIRRAGLETKINADRGAVAERTFSEARRSAQQAQSQGFDYVYPANTQPTYHAPIIDFTGGRVLNAEILDAAARAYGQDATIPVVLVKPFSQMTIRERLIFDQNTNRNTEQLRENARKMIQPADSSSVLSLAQLNNQLRTMKLPGLKRRNASKLGTYKSLFDMNDARRKKGLAPIPIPANAKAFYDGEKIYLFADKLTKDQVVPALLHELVHAVLLRPEVEAFSNLIRAWANTAGPNQALAQRAAQRVDAAMQDSARSQFDDFEIAHEMVAYFVEEFALSQDPNALASIEPSESAELKQLVEQQPAEITSGMDLIRGLLRLVSNLLGGAGVQVDNITAEDMVAALLYKDSAFRRPRSGASMMASLDNARSHLREFADTAFANAPNGVQIGGKVLNRSTRKLIQGFQFRHYFVRAHEYLFPARDGQKSSLVELNDNLVAAERTKYMVEQEGVRAIRAAEKWSYSRQRAVTKFIQKMTERERWAFTPEWENATKPEAVDVELEAEFLRDFNEDERTVIYNMFRVMDQTQTQLIESQIAQVEKSYEALLSDTSIEETKRADLEKARDRDLRTLINAPNRMAGYMPLRMKGKFAVVYKSKMLSELEKVGGVEARTNFISKLSREEVRKHYYVEFATSYSTALEIQAQIERQNTDMQLVGNVSAFERERKNSSDVLPYYALNIMRQKAEEFRVDRENGGMSTATANGIIAAINNIYVDMLAEDNIRKSTLERQDLFRHTQDMFSNFSESIAKSAGMIAALDTERTTLEARQRFRADAFGSATSNEKTAEVYNEMMERIAIQMEYSPVPWVGKTMAFTSTWMLLTSPAYYIQNATQPFLYTLPVIAGEFNDFSGTMKQMMGAYSSVSKAWSKTNVPANKMDIAAWFGGAMLELDNMPENKRNPAKWARERQVFERMEELNLLDVGMASDLGSMAMPRVSDAELSAEGDRPSAKLTGLRLLSRAHTKMIHGVRSVEVINRGVTGLTAYRMHYAKNKDHQAALDFAMQTNIDTQGDYSTANNPKFFSRIFGVNVLPAVVQFRKFQLIQMSNLASMVSKVFKGESVEERAVGARQLMYILGMHGAVGGALALPFAQSGVMGLAAKALFGDDDEPADVEYLLRSRLGNDAVADLVINGFPSMLGVRMTEKLGMGQGLVAPYLDLSEDRNALFTLAGSLVLGPTGGLAQQFYGGASLMMEGHTTLGIAKMMPKGLKDVMNSLYRQSEGLTKLNPQRDMLLSPDEIGMDATLWSALGFTPNQLSDSYNTRAWKREIETNFSAEASKLDGKYIRAYEEGDREMMREATKEFRELQQRRRKAGFPMRPMSDLTGSVAEKAKRRANTSPLGAQYSNSSRQFVQNLER